MAWIVPPLIAIEMVKVQMALYWARVLMCLNVCCLSASWRLSYREVFILQTGAYGESGCCLALTNILLKSSLSVNECDSQNGSLFFLWDVIHFLFSSNAFPSIFNGVCWKLVKPGKLNEVLEEYLCLAQLHKKQQPKAQLFNAWGQMRCCETPFYLPNVKLWRLELFLTPHCQHTTWSPRSLGLVPLTVPRSAVEKWMPVWLPKEMTLLCAPVFVFQLINQKTTMCTQLNNCRSFVSVLEYLLAIGNYLNDNARKGKAKGFRLSSLAKVRLCRRRRLTFDWVAAPA